MKYSSIGFSDFSHSSELMFDPLAELDRDCIFAFLIVFFFFLCGDRGIYVYWRVRGF